MGNKTRYSSQFAFVSKQVLDFAPTLLIGANAAADDRAWYRRAIGLEQSRL
jgi:hypothetical protein